MGLRGRGAVPMPRPAAPAGLPARPRRHSGASRVGDIIDFLQSLPITKGHLQGRRMRLLPSQRRFIENVYGGRADGGPIRLAVLSEPRGNGKTTFLAGLTLCHLCQSESIPRGELYSASID